MKKVMIFIIILILLLLVGGFWIAGSSLTSPLNQSVGNCPDGVVCEDVEFPSESGATIKGWFIRGVENKGVVVLMHGQHGNRNMPERINFLHKAGYSVLTFDFQSHGESVGKRLTFGYLESRDAEAALKFVREKMPNEKIGVIGMSMGGAAFLLQKNPQKTDAVILEMVYPTIQNAIKNRLNLRLFPGAENLSPLMTWQFPMRLGVSADELRPIDKIADCKIPKLLIAGEKDKHTTLEESKQLFDASSEPKELWVIPKAEHVDLYKYTPQDYEEKALKFFDKNLRNSRLN